MEKYLITFFNPENYMEVDELTDELIKMSDLEEIEIERYSDLKKYVKGDWIQSETLLYVC